MPPRGLELARRFYDEAVRPILERSFPRLEHAAGLIGPGSEILGYDDDLSTDHDWGPRAQLFVRDAGFAPEVESALARELPAEFGGFRAHRVEVFATADYLRERIGVDPLEGFGVADWLMTPSQRLLELTAGAVFADPIGDLTRVRELLDWYPHDVWLVVMAGHWRRVAQLEHVAGRTASRVVAASLVRELMRLALLQERRYPPYAKWLETAYAALKRPEAPVLEAALAAASAPERKAALVEASEAVARRHGELGVTEPVEPTVRPFHDRPYLVLLADRFVNALHEAVSDPALPARAPAGGIDAIVDNAHILTRPALWRRLVNLYDRA
jgi:Domain of unknown function (DUF4037)